MTSFFCLLRRQHSATAAHDEVDIDHIAARGSSALSRGGHIIQHYHDDLLCLSAFENSAWGVPQTIFDDGTTVSWTAGNPLCVEMDGSIKPIDDSRQALHQSLIALSEDALRSTKGSFAAIAWTRKTKRLVICADKLALRPIYVAFMDHLIAVSTSMHALEVALSPFLTASKRGIAERLFFGINLGNSTIYNEIQRLQPAQLLVLSPTSAQSLFYFDWAYHLAKLSRHDPPPLRILHEAFLTAIQRRSILQTEDAFLSGGLDSRCVVGGLLDLGVTVRTFGSSYEHSLDDVISSTMATRFGIDHIVHRKRPSERILADQDNFAKYARDHFPRPCSSAATGRRIWSGDGGSVGLGHVYLTHERIALAGSDITSAALSELFPALRNARSRIIRSSLLEEYRQQALQSCLDQFVKLSTAPPERRLYLFYLLNDQSHHLDLHHDAIDETDIELETPFFDPDFLTAVSRYPIDLCLRHNLYNQWLHLFRSPVNNVAWQSYPGHIPAPIPLPQDAETQWSSRWYKDHTARRALTQAVREVLIANNPILLRILRPRIARLITMLTALGYDRWQHELHTMIHLSNWLRNIHRLNS